MNHTNHPILNQRYRHRQMVVFLLLLGCCEHLLQSISLRFPNLHNDSRVRLAFSQGKNDTADPYMYNTTRVFTTTVTTVTKSVSTTSIPLHANTSKTNTQKNILFMIRSFPGRYPDRVSLQARTWLRKLDYQTEGILIASIFEPTKGAEWTRTRALREMGLDSVEAAFPDAITVHTPWCPESSHGLGLCCQESRALLRAAVDTTYDWVFVIDEDIYVHPPLLRQILAQYSPEKPWALGTPGCGVKIDGFCGGGGYAISRPALLQLVSLPDYYEAYMRLCHVEEFCDIITSHLLKHNCSVPLTRIDGFHPWGVTEAQISKYLPSKHMPTIHEQQSYIQRLQEVNASFNQPTGGMDEHETLLPLEPSRDMIELLRDTLRAYPSPPNSTTHTNKPKLEELQSILTGIRQGDLCTLHYYGAAATRSYGSRLEKMAFLQLLFDIAAD